MPVTNAPEVKCNPYLGFAEQGSFHVEQAFNAGADLGLHQANLSFEAI